MIFTAFRDVVLQLFNLQASDYVPFLITVFLLIFIIRR